MRSSRTLALVLLLIAPALSAQEYPAQFHMVVLGSSTAAGAGAQPSDSAWVNRYRTYLQGINPAYQVSNLARGGYTTYHVQSNSYAPPEGRPSPDIARNITKAISLVPSAIIVNLPSNDAALKFTLEEQQENFNRIVAEASLWNIPVWVCTTQPRNLSEAQRQNLQAMRDWLHDTYGERCLDFWTGLDDGSGGVLAAFDSGDGVHLNNAGHRLLFERTAAADIPRRLTPTSIAAVPAAHSFNVEAWPNPFTDAIHVHVQGPAGTPITIRLFDMLGNVVYEAQQHTFSGSYSVHIDSRGLGAGAHYYQASVGGVIRSGILLHQ